MAFIWFPAETPIAAGMFKSVNFWGTPNREPVRPVAVARWVHSATAEVQDVSVRAINRTAPVVAGRTYVAQRSTGTTVTGGRKKRNKKQALFVFTRKTIIEKQSFIR